MEHIYYIHTINERTVHIGSPSDKTFSLKHTACLQRPRPWAGQESKSEVLQGSTVHIWSDDRVQPRADYLVD